MTPFYGYIFHITVFFVGIRILYVSSPQTGQWYGAWVLA